jgi:hypothetical protein
MKAARKGESYCQASDWCIILSGERKYGLLDCPFFRQDHEMKVSTLHPENILSGISLAFLAGGMGLPWFYRDFSVFN